MAKITVNLAGFSKKVGLLRRKQKYLLEAKNILEVIQKVNSLKIDPNIKQVFDKDGAFSYNPLTLLNDYPILSLRGLKTQIKDGDVITFAYPIRLGTIPAYERLLNLLIYILINAPSIIAGAIEIGKYVRVIFSRTEKICPVCYEKNTLKYLRKRKRYLCTECRISSRYKNNKFEAELWPKKKIFSYKNPEKKIQEHLNNCINYFQKQKKLFTGGGRIQ